MNYRRKEISDKNKISMLLPTRGRPQKLDAVLRQYDITVHHHHLFDAWIYVDDDDRITREYIDSGCWKNLGYKINWVIEPSALTMGQMCNTLWQRCTTNPGIYLPAGDDYIFKTMHWDDVLRSTFDQFPDRIGIAHIPDPLDSYDDVTWPVFSAEWLNAVGYMLTEYFAFWYDDLWIGEICKMVDRIIKVPLELEAVGGKGKTPRMKNILFWNYFYINTLDERIETANRLAEIINPESGVVFDESHPLVSQFKSSVQYQYQYQPGLTDLANIEKLLSVPEYYADDSKLSRYRTIEQNAVNHLCAKIKKYAAQGNEIRVKELQENLLLASISNDNLNDLSASSVSKLDMMPFNQTNELSRKIACKYESLLKDKAVMITSIIGHDFVSNPNNAEMVPGNRPPKVSVIIPSYNRARMLGITIESFIKQDYPADSFEIIVSDNNSTDNTREVVADWQSRSTVPIKYMFEQRQGVHYARNSAAKIATGDILYFTDDDMIADNRLLTEIVKVFLLDPLVGTATGRVLPKWESEPPEWILQRCYNGLLSISDGLGEGIIIEKNDLNIYSCHQAIRRDAFFRSGGFNPESTYTDYLGDGETGLKIKLIALGYKLGYNSKSIIHHMIPPSRMTQDYLNKRLANQGSAECYTEYRKNRFSTEDLLRRVVFYQQQILEYAFYATLERIAGEVDWHMDEGKTHYYLSRIAYDLRLMHDPQWRELVLKDDWINE
jgi:glycosyltransferase involved in cell wall biosynthesis